MEFILSICNKIGTTYNLLCTKLQACSEHRKYVATYSFISDKTKSLPVMCIKQSTIFVSIWA